ncbi:ribonuclease 1-like [Tripterygium wilfordii]|uniref:ribonuclease 1-like n=1 Tax=Tripterygium wilfordii TaxID=458696 RepID=UPI0018F80959|nr:ribonuclease 1-like [Tripterygium wilfordii]
MGKEVGVIGNVIGFILAVIIIMFLAGGALAVGERPTGSYDFLILSWLWPKAHCNTGERRCETPIRPDFSLHGLWPAYRRSYSEPPYEEIWLVPSYSEVNGCTTIPPADSSTISSELFATYRIIDDMKLYWPDVTRCTFSSTTVNFWRIQFARHGMCFDYPNHPIFYFMTTLHLTRKFDIRGILEEGNILPGNQYVIENILHVIKERLGKVIRIRCNRDSSGRDQLYEIWLCINKYLKLTSCVFPTFGCPLVQEKIWYHSPHALNH